MLGVDLQQPIARLLNPHPVISGFIQKNIWPGCAVCVKTKWAFVARVGNGSVAIKNVHAGSTAEPYITLIILYNVIKLTQIFCGIESHHFQLVFRVYDFKARILPTGCACKK